MTKTILALIVATACLATAAQPAAACTNLLVTKGASADGSVIITYLCDGEGHCRLGFTPAADHKPDEVIEIPRGEKEPAKVKQVPHTFAVVDMINEHQLAIGETTFVGREELINPDGAFAYHHLIQVTLQRAKTAREAIKIMTDLVAEHGYRSEGESISIGDPNEAWLLEIIGPGPGGQGAHWVAVKIPDGQICAHANKARIGTFPLDDPENCLYSKNVINFAIEKGYYDPDSGRPFSFCDAYCPATPESLRYASTRVWSIFRRAAPSLNLLPDYHRAVEGAKPYPLWIKPDKKLSVANVFALLRDHYEDTPYDMTEGIDAGPFGQADRNRPTTWEIDGVTYAWERPISTQQTCFAFVSQSRSWLPDPIGGVFWYSVDNTYTSCFVPFYCGITSIPESYTFGSLQKFSWDSLWWTFNFVSNYANLRYRDMVPEIQAVQREIEGNFLALQPAVEKTALELYNTNQELMGRYLTDYCTMRAELVHKRWRQLGEDLITKYNDGYVKNEQGMPVEQGYPETWLRRVIKKRPEQFRLPEAKAGVPKSRLVD